MTPDEEVARVKAALREVGYGHVEVWACDPPSGYISPVYQRKTEHGLVLSCWSSELPREVWWRALAVSGASTCCWDCYDGTEPHLCDHDIMASFSRSFSDQKV